VQEGVIVKLENQSYDVIATAITDAQGAYTFDNLTASGAELDVLFAQEWNEQHYGIDEVASWVWLDSITLSSGGAVELPDFEIGIQGFGQINPPTGASFSAGGISASNPLLFEWHPYPGASAYWVDLMKGNDLSTVWRSSLVDTTSAPFDGALNDGSHIAADTYWWGVGARKNVVDYRLTAYGYLAALIVTP